MQSLFEENFISRITVTSALEFVASADLQGRQYRCFSVPSEQQRTGRERGRLEFVSTPV